MIIVTGSSGLLGQQILSKLGNDGYPFPSRQICDLSQKKEVASTIEKIEQSKKSEISGIIHTAAYTSVNNAEREKRTAYDVNVQSTRILANWAREKMIPLLYISTASVFDGEEGNYTVEDYPNPQNYYSLTKLLGEESTLAYGGIVARLTLIGIHQNQRTPSNFLEWLSVSIAAKKKINLYKDAIINPLSPSKASELLIDIIKRNDPTRRLWHLGTRDRISKADIGKYWLGKFFPDSSEYVEYGFLENLSCNVKRGRNLWLNVEEENYLLKLPTIETELKRLSEECKPWK